MNSIDQVLLSQICNVLDMITTPDTQMQMILFKQFQEFQLQLPTLCFYLIHILSSEQYSLNCRFCALIVLRRNFQNIQNELVPQFISIVKPLLEHILKLPLSPFTSVAASALCSMVVFFGIDHFPDFFQNILALFSCQDSIQIGLRCINEIVCLNLNMSDQILAIIPQFINSPFFKDALNITETLLENDVQENIDFVHKSIIPVIFTALNLYDELSMAQAASIAALVYLSYPDPIIGDFLVSCINIHSTIICEKLLTSINIPNSIVPYHPLIVSFLNLLQIPDEDYSVFGPCTMAQNILLEMDDCCDPDISPIVRDYMQTQCLNVGHYLRCLYTILSNQEDSHTFFQIIQENMSGEYRGEASLCLMCFCYANGPYVDNAIPQILPLLIDSDINVRRQANYALSELLEFEFSPVVEHFVFLFNLVKSTNDLMFAHLASQYSKHLPVLNFSEQVIVDIYHELIFFFLNSNPLSSIYVPMIDMLSIFIGVVLEPFESFNKDVINKVWICFNEPFDSSTFPSYFDLVESLIDVYGEFLSEVELFSNILAQSLNIMEESDSNHLVKNGFGIFLKFVQKTSNLSVIHSKLVSFMLDCFNSTRIEACGVISQLLSFLVFSMNQDQIDQIYMLCIKIVRSASEVTPEVEDVKKLGALITDHVSRNIIQDNTTS